MRGFMAPLTPCFPFVPGDERPRVAGKVVVADGTGGPSGAPCRDTVLAASQARIMNAMIRA